MGVHSWRERIIAIRQPLKKMPEISMSDCNVLFHLFKELELWYGLSRLNSVIAGKQHFLT